MQLGDIDLEQCSKFHGLRADSSSSDTDGCDEENFAIFNNNKPPPINILAYPNQIVPNNSEYKSVSGCSASTSNTIFENKRVDKIQLQSYSQISRVNQSDNAKVTKELPQLEVEDEKKFNENVTIVASKKSKKNKKKKGKKRCPDNLNVAEAVSEAVNFNINDAYYPKIGETLQIKNIHVKRCEIINQDEKRKKNKEICLKKSKKISAPSQDDMAYTYINNLATVGDAINKFIGDQFQNKSNSTEDVVNVVESSVSIQNLPCDKDINAPSTSNYNVYNDADQDIRISLNVEPKKTVLKNLNVERGITEIIHSATVDIKSEFKVQTVRDATIVTKTKSKKKKNKDLNNLNIVINSAVEETQFDNAQLTIDKAVNQMNETCQEATIIFESTKSKKKKNKASSNSNVDSVNILNNCMESVAHTATVQKVQSSILATEISNIQINNTCQEGTIALKKSKKKKQEVLKNSNVEDFLPNPENANIQINNNNQEVAIVLKSKSKKKKKAAKISNESEINQEIASSECIEWKSVSIGEKHFDINRNINILPNPENANIQIYQSNQEGAIVLKSKSKKKTKAAKISNVEQEINQEIYQSNQEGAIVLKSNSKKKTKAAKISNAEQEINQEIASSEFIEWDSTPVGEEHFGIIDNILPNAENDSYQKATITLKPKPKNKKSKTRNNLNVVNGIEEITNSIYTTIIDEVQSNVHMNIVPLTENKSIEINNNNQQATIVLKTKSKKKKNKAAKHPNIEQETNKVMNCVLEHMAIFEEFEYNVQQAFDNSISTNNNSQETIIIKSKKKRKKNKIPIQNVTSTMQGTLQDSTVTVETQLDSKPIELSRKNELDFANNSNINQKEDTNTDCTESERIDSTITVQPQMDWFTLEYITGNELNCSNNSNIYQKEGTKAVTKLKLPEECTKSKKVYSTITVEAQLDNKPIELSRENELNCSNNSNRNQINDTKVDAKLDLPEECTESEKVDISVHAEADEIRQKKKRNKKKKKNDENVLKECICGYINNETFKTYIEDVLKVKMSEYFDNILVHHGDITAMSIASIKYAKLASRRCKGGRPVYPTFEEFLQKNSKSHFVHACIAEYKSTLTSHNQSRLPISKKNSGLEKYYAEGHFYQGFYHMVNDSIATCSHQLGETAFEMVHSDGDEEKVQNVIDEVKSNLQNMNITGPITIQDLTKSQRSNKPTKSSAYIVEKVQSDVKSSSARNIGSLNKPEKQKKKSKSSTAEKVQTNDATETKEDLHTEDLPASSKMSKQTKSNKKSKSVECSAAVNLQNDITELPSNQIDDEILCMFDEINQCSITNKDEIENVNKTKGEECLQTMVLPEATKILEQIEPKMATEPVDSCMMLNTNTSSDQTDESPNQSEDEILRNIDEIIAQYLTANSEEVQNVNETKVEECVQTMVSPEATNILDQTKPNIESKSDDKCLLLDTNVNTSSNGFEIMVIDQLAKNDVNTTEVIEEIPEETTTNMTNHSIKDKKILEITIKIDRLVKQLRNILNKQADFNNTNLLQQPSSSTKIINQSENDIKFDSYTIEEIAYKIHELSKKLNEITDVKLNEFNELTDKSISFKEDNKLDVTPQNYMYPKFVNKLFNICSIEIIRLIFKVADAVKTYFNCN